MPQDKERGNRNIHNISMRGGVSVGIGFFLAVATFYLILSLLPLVFENNNLGEVKDTGAISTTTLSKSPASTIRTTTKGETTTTTAPSQGSQSAEEQAWQQAEQLLEQEIESIDNQTDESIVNIITGSATGLYIVKYK